jgi:RNA polymerase sigma-70 factor (ECF subfamily)
MPLEDSSSLIDKARNGDREAFDLLARRAQAQLAAFIRRQLGRRLRRRIEVEDVLQETLLRAYRSCSSLEARTLAGFRSWLETIASRVLIDLARRHEARPVTPLVREVPASGVTPSRLLRRKERFTRLEDALQSLSPEHREVIRLARIERLPLEEVARRMERSYAATAQLLSRALRRLRVAFGETESLHLPPPAERDNGKDD